MEVGTSAVVNAVSSVSGRYPNLGPGILMEAGIPLIDNVGDHVFSRVHEGEWLTLDGGKLVNSAGSVIAEGTLFTTEILEDHLEYARRLIGSDRGIRRKHHDVPAGGERAAARGCRRA